MLLTCSVNQTCAWYIKHLGCESCHAAWTDVAWVTISPPSTQATFRSGRGVAHTPAATPSVGPAQPPPRGRPPTSAAHPIKPTTVAVEHKGRDSSPCAVPANGPARATVAAYCRATPAGLVAVSEGAAGDGGDAVLVERVPRVSRSPGRPAGRVRRPPFGWSAGGRNSTRCAFLTRPAPLSARGWTSSRSGFGRGAGWLIASCWAIPPPIDMPTMCAENSEPERVEQPSGVVGHVHERVRRGRPRRAEKQGL